MLPGKRRCKTLCKPRVVVSVNVLLRMCVYVPELSHTTIKNKEMTSNEFPMSEEQIYTNEYDRLKKRPISSLQTDVT